MNIPKSNCWSVVRRLAVACLALAGLARADSGGHEPEGHGDPRRPYLVLAQPLDGTRAKAGPIDLEALARDPSGGPIVRVDFVANDVVVASSDLSGQPFPAVIGLTVRHKAVWTNPPAGFSRLQARATVRGAAVASAVATVGVGEAAWVGVVATDPFAGEGTPANPGTFRVRRWPSSPASPELRVRVRWGGSAANGVDYEAMPSEVVIPAGAEAVDATVKPVNDALREGPESVALELSPVASLPGQPLPYAIGRNGRAWVVIADVPPPLPVVPKVTVTAPGAEIIEGNPDGRLSFRIDRDGPTTDPLTVTYVMTGKATYGIDYVPAKPASGAAALAGGPEGFGYRQSVTIPAGATSATIQFAPVVDARTEGDETVVLVLVPGGPRGPSPAYRLGDPSYATGIIHDSVPVPADLPAISIVATTPETSEPTTDRVGVPAVLTLVRSGPTNLPAKVFYRVGGTAANGRDYRFLDGDATIPAGETRRDIRIVPFFDGSVEGDETVGLSLRTNRAYVVKEPSTATATIHEGVVATKPSLVLTAPANGSKVTNPVVVALAADATDPKGYIATVEFVADGIVVVKSALEFIQAPKPGTTLHHAATWTNPPVGPHGVVARAVTADGIRLESGKALVEVLPKPEPPPVVRHPADNNPADDVLAADEVAAYASAWLSGSPFVAGPSPVPAAHATRAGYLLRNGGGYRYDPTVGPLPLAWVSDVVVAPIGGSGAVSHAVAEVPVVPENTPFVVTIRLVPIDGVKAQAVEEVVGPGAVVTDISDGGVHDTVAGIIRWGVYLDDTARKLAATVTLPDARKLTGLASFDGADIRIPQVPPPPPLPGYVAAQARIASVLPLETGSVQLMVVDEATTGETAIEVSTDLVHWQRVEQTQASGDTSVHVDSDANENFQRFYRLVPVVR
ncbi:MAG: hypothetical protein DVB31_16530 [Verrucomicrobia bacterium]|nr:MAG: hypothetical protein DVB31_16530 [Verrucomicrobiota bacterium]